MGDHARVISGMFNNEEGQTYLIVNDPLPEEPVEYAISLDELYRISLTWNPLSLTAYSLTPEQMATQ